MLQETTLGAVYTHFEGINWGTLGTHAQGSDDPRLPPVAHVDDAFTWFHMADGATFCGPEGYVDLLRGWRSAFPDGWWEITALQPTLQATGAGAICRSIFRGRHTGLLTTALGVLPGTGTEVALPMCDIFHTHQGRLLSIHSYFDLATLVRQLGRAPVAGLRPQHLFLVN